MDKGAIHGMTTRSKVQDESDTSEKEPAKFDVMYDTFAIEELDGHGNIPDLIDDSELNPDDALDLRHLLLGGEKTPQPKTPKTPKTTPRRPSGRKGKRGPPSMDEMLISLLILKATEKANLELKRSRRNKKKRIQDSTEDPDDEDSTEESEEPDEDSTEEPDEEPDEEHDEEHDEDSTEEPDDEELGIELSESDIELSESDEEEPDDKLSESEEDYLFEYDDLDEEYEEMVDKQSGINSEENDMEYYHHLESEKKKHLMEQTKEIYRLTSSDVPLRFKIIESCMDMKTKAIAMENADKLKEMDVSTGEHSKLDHWINGLMKIPFGTYRELSIGPQNSLDEKRTFIQDSYKTLNRAIYGHKDAKTHILQVLGKWIKNPQSGGNVLAIQGPMGNGKTTLVKEGISKVLDRPFAFIALGGASDSAFFDGHCYTYEGSHWGRIVQILQDSKCMNPVFYFDELDKVSDTQKGEEIIHMLTHLTDPSQNSLFQDNYFPGVNLDLSKALFIFSYNDENRVNRILRDRMYVINTKGFSSDDKLKISREYLIPEIYTNYEFKEDELIIDDEILKNIIQTYTNGEEGVRNLKRCIETIVSKINIYMLTYDKDDPDSTKDLSFQLKDFQIPLKITRDHMDILLTIGGISDKPPFHMYT